MNRNFFVKTFGYLSFLILISATLTFAQKNICYAGSYYSGINSSSPSFVNDLETLVRGNCTRIAYGQYDETNIANFASRDTTGGQRVVTCVYSGENYVYTPPFAWGAYSREHTFCYSWMPTYTNTSADENRYEYCDQHHLFPTNQNQVNGIRSNHPLGIVANQQSRYLQCKFGTDAQGNTVFEPRDCHKGDAARALLYMCLRYDGLDGYTWNFNTLNRRLSAINEAPEDLKTLLVWNEQDPPDAWEVSRNNYIQSIQGNRNPFVDHPEYVNLIDFTNMTLKASALAEAPSIQPANLSETVTDSSITLKWDRGASAQAPQGYFVSIFKGDNYIIPVGGYSYPESSDISNGRAYIYVPYSGPDSLKIFHLKSATDYLITVCSYNGSGDKISYNTTGVPQILAHTTGQGFPTVNFALENSSLDESAGTYSIDVSISSTDNLISDAKVNLVLKSGDPNCIGGYSTQSLIFSKGGALTQSLKLNITDDNLARGTQTLIFDLVSPDGAVEIGTKREFSLSILDNDGTAGGEEQFANFPVTGSSYLSGTFSGSDGSTWSYTSCSGNTTGIIGSPTPVLKKDASAKVESGIIQGGCGTLSLDYMQAFSANVNLGVYVNDILVGTLVSSSEVGKVKTASGINPSVEGPFKLRFQQIDGYAGQVSIDNIKWTGYGTSGVSKTGGEPSSFLLIRNYPNPFNPETRIEYSLPKESKVLVQIYDVLGNRIAELVNKRQTAGTYSLPFRASNLASGVYLAVIKTEAGLKTIKMSLLK